MEVVTIRLQSQYQMPRVCCACGAPAGAGKLMISRSSLWEARFLNLAFPLCDRCALLAQSIGRRRRRVLLTGLGASLLFCAVAFGLGQTFVAVPGGLLDRAIGLLLLLAVLTFLGSWVGRWLASLIGLTAESRATYRRVSGAVRVRRYDPDPFGGGYVTFAFGNRDFADRFQEMNTGVVLEGR